MSILNNYSRIVVKIGSNTLTHSTGNINLRRMEALVRTLADFKNSGNEIVLVSSGAVAAGISKVSLGRRPSNTEEKMALAAIGQAELMQMYERFFSAYGHTVAQILMTKDVIDNEVRRSAAESTFCKLLELGVVPIVNENDSVSSEEIKFGGNDTLSAYVALVCGADILINMSDIDGLYECDPRTNPDAKLISRVDEINDTIISYAGGAGSERGTGGMITKIKAAQIVTSAGIPMLIVNGKNPEVLYQISDGKHIGTYFAANKK
ncbi:MAG: glutamate 5-kinase [Clostridiales bacterium]|nr:glutamate 5-kinase [Clostridiales bacterium]